MKQTRAGSFLFAAIIWIAQGFSAFAQNAAFVNFETAPVHPLALSPDGKMLAVCNLPNAAVELFDLTEGSPRRIGSVFTGIDPVTARFNANGELWVVNHISDSISVIDISRQLVVATLECFDGPADVVFTKNPPRAFVSHAGANLIEIWDSDTRNSLGSFDIEGDRPKAMALSKDENEIYIAILESGNASTIIAPPITEVDRTPPFSVIDLPEGPHGGLNPFPNAGAVFDPPLNPDIPATDAPPRVGLIVRKQEGRWLDDSHGDWTEYVSGTNAFMTGRVPGWDIADHDLAILNTTNRSVRYVRGLMNICFDVSVNPVSGRVALIGTDAINEVRFEPVLQSIFVRMKLALVDPTGANPPAISDLNPHLDYKVRNLPKAERRQTVGDPRGIAWNARGTRAYVTAMGSNNLLMLDENGNRVGRAVELPDGPTGALFDEQRNRVYVFARFASKLLALDADTLAITAAVPIFDPTPAAVAAGRKHFYNTIENSGLGQASCASCHIDGRADRLAWDLGSQTGDMLAITNRNFFVPANATNSFHPMKGPMVTQTLQDIIGHEPFHWRGDRSGIEEFSPTFIDLQGADEELTEEEMQEFEDFLATISFPPNNHRNLDNSLPNIISVNELSLGRGLLAAGNPLPPGSPLRGLLNFRSATDAACLRCHTLPTGLGPDARFLALRWQNIAPGPLKEHHLGMTAMRRTSDLPFKVPHLRNLFDKIGFDLRGPVSRAGFGFAHDGRVDSLTKFLQDGFDVRNDQETSDLIAFLLAFTGSDLPAGIATDQDRPPGVSSRDVSGGVGFQHSLFSSSADGRISFMISHARNATSRVDLIVRGIKESQPRSWLMLRNTSFVSDKAGETNTATEVLAHATSNTPLTFTFVPPGSGARLALDQDSDGFFNQTEIEAGSDPANAAVTPDTTTPRLSAFALSAGQVRIEWFGRIGSSYRVQTRSALDASSDWTDYTEPIPLTANPASWSETVQTAATARFYRIIYVP